MRIILPVLALFAISDAVEISVRSRLEAKIRKLVLSEVDSILGDDVLLSQLGLTSQAQSSSEAGTENFFDDLRAQAENAAR